MKLLVMSDLHLEHHALKVKCSGFDAVVLAGDICSPGHRGVLWAASEPAFGDKPVLMVPGNHEYYGCQMETELDRMRSAAIGTNVHVMDRDVVVLGDVRFLGVTLWTDFALPVSSAGSMCSDPIKAGAVAAQGMNDFDLIRVERDQPQRGTRKLRVGDTVDMHQDARTWLRAQQTTEWSGRTVVITHHGPHPLSSHPRYAGDWINPAFVNALPERCFDGVDLWIHGHTHDSFDYQVGRPSGGSCRVVCNPRGYQRRDGSDENRSFVPSMCVDV